MNSRCITLILGPVGALLAAALLPMAVAFADEYVYKPEPPVASRR